MNPLGVPTPLGVPADLKSAVKKVRPIKTGGFIIPLHPLLLIALLIAFLIAADCKSAEHKKVRTFFNAGFEIISG